MDISLSFSKFSKSKNISDGFDTHIYRRNKFLKDAITHFQKYPSASIHLSSFTSAVTWPDQSPDWQVVMTIKTVW